MSNRPGRRSIFVAEPQCRGFEHATYNAALLYAISEAYPSHRLVFYAEESHHRWVRDKLICAARSVEIETKPALLPARNSPGLTRLPLEFKLCKRILAEAQREGAEALVMCSVTATGLLALKVLMKAICTRLPTIAVVHGVLSTVDKTPRRVWSHLVALKHILALPHPRTLRLIALGDSILNNLKNILPNCTRHWHSMDLVYLWPADGSRERQTASRDGETVRFGYVGDSAKGFEAFCNLANEIAPSQQAARFVTVGFYSGPHGARPICQNVSQISDRPLSRGDFDAGLSQLTYLVWLGAPDRYRLAASATFLDALAFMKPGIYLRNDFIEHYFDRMGDIGYLCDTYEEIADTVKNILVAFPKARYRQQVENIRRGRMLFEPKTVAPRLRNILENCKVPG